MRVLPGVFLVLLCAGAFAQTVDDQSAAGVDAEVVAAIVALATRDLAAPDAAQIRKLRKSRARNGRGYCGEISLVEDGAFTVFHAILEGGTGPSVLFLADYPETDQSSSAETVRRLMRNFGCTE